MDSDANWREKAACANVTNLRHFDPWFPASNVYSATRRICDACPVRRDCLQEALESEPHVEGFWGGLSEQERRRLRKKA